MTVETSISRSGPYAGAGTTGPFPVSFRFLDNTHLSVVRTDANGIDSVLVLGADYTVLGAGNPTGSVTLTTALAVDFKLTILRAVPKTQEADYVQNDDFPAESHENALDKLTMITQELSEASDRSIKIGVSDAALPALPPASGRVNTIIGFDSAGNLTLLPAAASVGAGDMRVDVFTAGVDFTSGVTTQLNVSRAPGSQANAEIFFDSGFQGTDQWSVAGSVITFTSPIPVGVAKVFVRLGTTLSINIPPFGSVGDSELAWGNILHRVVNSVSELQALDGTKYLRATTVGYYAAGDGGGGAEYWQDYFDTTSVHNGVTVIVANDGKRWKMVNNGKITARQAGARGAPYDDYIPLQNGLNACALARIGCFEFTNGTFLTSQQLLIRQGAQTTSSDAGSDIHFMGDQNKLVISSDSHATLKATAAMTSVLRFSPTTVGGLGSYANFYSEIRGLLIDGNGLANIGVYIDSAMHVEIEKNSITGVTTGIYNTGYGVHNIRRNVIRATACISYVGGGDSKFEHNDLYIPSGGVGILMAPFAGSTLIERNTFTPTDVSGVNSNVTAISLRADNPGDDVKALGAITISHNCFDGVRYGVYGRGYSAAIRNVRDIDIHDNYIGAAGASVTCDLVDFAFADSLNIHDNRVTPGLAEPRLRSLGTLYTVTNTSVHDNKINGCNFDGLTLDGACSDIVVEGNKFSNVGVGNTAQAFVRVKGSCDTNHINRNTFIQSDAAGALNGVVEEGSADRTFADFNKMYSLITTEYTKVGANSVMKSRLQQSAAPGSGTWLAGSQVEFTAPAAGGKLGSVCVTSGTPGTWKSFGSIDP